MYKDNKSGGSIITERLHMDVKQDFFFFKKKECGFRDRIQPRSFRNR